jgi:hypothetical protein
MLKQPFHINTHAPHELPPPAPVLPSVDAAAGGTRPEARDTKYSSTALRRDRFCLRRLWRNGRLVSGDLMLVNSHCAM